MRTKDVANEGNYGRIRKQWESACSAAREAHASSALFLRYSNLDSSKNIQRIEECEFCGVCKTTDNDNSGSGCNPRKSIFALAGEIIEACERTVLEAGGNPHNASNVYEANAAMSNSSKKPKKNADNDEEVLEAENLYNQFLFCASCRLRAVETGRRDARRIERRKTLGIREFSPEFGENERSCPGSQSRGDAKSYSRLNKTIRPAVLTISLAAAVGIGLPVCLYCFFQHDTLPKLPA